MNVLDFRISSIPPRHGYFEVYLHSAYIMSDDSAKTELFWTCAP
ncbi:protein of unknown function [Caballeronia sp. S22]